MMRAEIVWFQISLVFLAIVQINSVWSESPVYIGLPSTQKLSTSYHSKNKSIPTRIARGLKENNVFNSSFVPETHRQKWQVGRVSRKTYEIVNMLWRKTKIFQDQNEATTKMQSRKNYYSNKTYPRYPKDLQKVLHKSITPTSTPSFFEFYYMDEIEDGIKNKDNTLKKSNKHIHNKSWPFQHFADFKLTLLNPVLAFHVDNANQKRADLVKLDFIKPTKKVIQKKEEINRSSLPDLKFVNLFTVPNKFSFTQQRQNTIPMIRNTQKGISTNVTKKPISKYTIQVTNKMRLSLKTPDKQGIRIFSASTMRTTTATSISTTTEYDKIKFFEIYDRNTYKPIVDEKDFNTTNDVKSDLFDNHANNDEETLLEHVNQNIGHGHNETEEIKLAKKHIVDHEHNNGIYPARVSQKFEIRRFTINMTNDKRFHYKVEALKETTPTVSKPPTVEHGDSKYGNWSEYPFAAVYIYEPLQVHCDAATISSHWLLTAGSCLARHHKKPTGLGRSAFVTYCGETWWDPGRVAYVKYSVVHPGFHPRDKTRKRLYNMGLIQVADSMSSACTGWQPVTLMSHRLIVDNVNARGTAVGWGLDRFDTKYPSSDLPRLTLSVYQGQVYSDSCPGNAEYSKAKRLDENDGTKNVYCLSLPPYFREENDAVHGGLLLVGGKLVALYLQEERRPWGEQCAEYTGTWRLIPWVLEIAREPEDTDSFTGEI